MAFLEWSGKGKHIYRNLKLIRRKNPPYPLRLMTTNVDAFHSFSVENGPTVENCEFAFMGDDFFNVHNRVWVIFQKPNDNSNTLQVIDTGDVLDSSKQDTPTYTCPLLVKGDIVKFYGLNTREMKGSALIESFQLITDPTLVATASTLYQVLNKPPYNSNLVGWDTASVRLYLVSFNNNTILNKSIINYDLIQYDLKSSMNTLVRNNYFHDSYDNCMRLQASNTIVTNNTFEYASSGMQVVFDQPWLEGSLGLSNITITYNTFRGVTGCTDPKTCVTIDSDITNVIVENNTFV